jgi:hypothetical protein
MEALKSSELHEQDDHLNRSDLMADEQAIGMAGGESLGMPGQPALGFEFPPSRPRFMGASPEQSMVAPVLTNEIRNRVIHYQRSADGTIAEAERCYTGEGSTQAGAG